MTFAGNNPATTTGTPNLVSGTCAQSSTGYNGGVIITGPGGAPAVGPVPEPGTFGLSLSSVLLAMVFLRFRTRSGRVSNTPGTPPLLR